MLDIRVIISAMNKASRDIDQVKKDIQGVGDASKTSSGSTENFGSKLKSLMGTAAAAAGAIAAVGLAVKEAYDFVKEGAAIERLQDASAQMAKSIGMDMDDVMDALRTASQGMVSDFDLMSAASRAMMLGVGSDSTEIARLFEIAALRGRVLGVDTSQAFNDIVTGIGRASPLILDNLGIVIDAEQAYGDYAASIGKTAEELSKAEQKQALVNAVIKSSAPLLAETGGLAVDDAGKFEQFEAAISNLSNSVANELSPAFAIISGDMAGFVNDIATNIIPGVEEMMLKFVLAKTAMENFNNVDFGDFMHAMGLVIGITSEEEVTTQTLLQAIRGMGGAFGESAQSIFDSSASFEQYSNSMTEAGYSLVYLTEEEWKNGKAARDAALANAEVGKAAEGSVPGVEALTDAEIAAAEAQAKMNAELANITSLDANYRGIINLAYDYTDMLEEKETLQIERQKLINQGWSEQSQKVKDLDANIAGIDASMAELADRVTLDMFQATIAIGGVTEAELAAYMQMAIDMGLMSEQGAQAAMDAYGNAIETINGYELDDKTGNIKFEIDDSAIRGYSPPTRYGTVVYSPLAQTQAVGGAVTGGNPYTWQEYGYRGEVFVPSADGFVLSRADAERALARALYGGESAIDPEAIGKAVAKALSGITGNKQGGGNVYNLTMPTSSNPADVRTAFELMEAWA